MTTIEAMKRALQNIAYELSGEKGLCGSYEDSISELRNAIAEVEAQSVEPVEFDIRCDVCGGCGLDPIDNNYQCTPCYGTGFTSRMLYTHPPRSLVGIVMNPMSEINKAFTKWSDQYGGHWVTERLLVKYVRNEAEYLDFTHFSINGTKGEKPIASILWIRLNSYLAERVQCC